MVLAVPGIGGAGRLAVSPDSQQLAFVYQEGAPVPADKLGVVPAAGGALRTVAQLPFGHVGLQWSPSGKALQYALVRNGAANIWEQPLSGGPPSQLTHFTSGGLISDFAWSRDGKQLILARGHVSTDLVLISNFH